MKIYVVTAQKAEAEKLRESGIPEAQTIESLLQKTTSPSLIPICIIIWGQVGREGLARFKRHVEPKGHVLRIPADNLLHLIFVRQNIGRLTAFATASK